MNTGKGLNDLGDYEGCINSAGLTYASMRIRVQTTSIYIGAWLPSECKNDSMLSILTDSIKKVIGIPGATVSLEFPNETTEEVTTGNILGFIFFSLLIVIALVGIATEYTSLFNKQNAREDDKVENSKTTLGLFFLSFSFTRNVGKIFWGPPAKEGDYLVIFNGVRVLSLLYVVFGHGYFSVLQSPLSDFEGVNRVLEPWSFYIVVGGLYAVDVFFFLSAFLAWYLMLGKFFKSSGINIPIIYFHRIYRLIFPIGLLICFVLTFLMYLGDGPIWRTDTYGLVEGCLDQWWQTILFIWNIVPYNNGMHCLGWLWYIANDMQFFLLVPFQIIAYKKHRYLGYGLTYFFLFGNILCSLIISAINKLSINPIVNPNYFLLLYVRPWTRIGAYQVGVLFGMFYYEWMNKENSHLFANSFGTKLFQAVYNLKVIRYSFYAIGFLVINVLMIMQYAEGRTLRDPKQYFSQFIHDLFNGFSRPLFVFCLMLILMGPLTGRNKFMQYVLGGSGYNPWARLSFMAYLTHLLVFRYFYGQIRQSTYITTKGTIFILLSVTFLTFVVSIPFSALFEAPFMQLEKLVLFPEKPKKQIKKTDESMSSIDSVGKENRVN